MIEIEPHQLFGVCVAIVLPLMVIGYQISITRDAIVEAIKSLKDKKEDSDG